MKNYTGPTAVYIGDMEDVDGRLFGLYNVFNCPGFHRGSTIAEQSVLKIPNVFITTEQKPAIVSGIIID